MNWRVSLLSIGIIGIAAACARKPDSTVFVNLVPFDSTAADVNALIRIHQNRRDPSDFAPNPPRRVKGRDGDVYVRARLVYPTTKSRTIEIEVTYKGNTKTMEIPLQALQAQEIPLPSGVLSVIAINEDSG